MARLNIEDKLEDGFKALVEALDYITDNSIQVLKYDDNSVDKAGTEVCVRALMGRQLFKNAPAWKCEFHIIAATHQDDDLDRAVLKRLYQECLGVIDVLLADHSGLATASGLNIDGVLSLDGDDPATDSKYQLMIAKCEVFLQQ